MPEWRPGNIVPIWSATSAVQHGAPCVEGGVPGVAVKSAVAPAGTGLGATEITQIGVGERFNLIVKGKVYVDNPAAAFSRLDPVYIDSADNTLVTAAGAGIVKFGVCIEIAGDRGVGTGKMRVDLDLKSTF